MRTNRKILLAILLFLLIFYAAAPLAVKNWYVFPHREIVEREAARYEMDPFLIAAIIHVESRFNAEAKSIKGATGLMQLMPDTALWITEQKNTLFDKKLLEDPEYNIELGCWYLANLKHEFEGEELHVLAAYNAGRGNVRKWLETGIWTGKVEDIEAIPFKETRDYLIKVQQTYAIYEKLYRK